MLISGSVLSADEYTESVPTTFSDVFAYHKYSLNFIRPVREHAE